MSVLRRAALLAAGVALVGATPAAAHGLVARSDLPVPEWLFTWGAAAVLVVSFVALSVLWASPRLQDEHARPLPAALGRALTSRAVEVVAGAVSVALLVFTIYAGLLGEQVPTGNWAPTFVYVVFWLGLVPASLLLGDVFRPLNPWRAIGRVTGWAVRPLLRGAQAQPLPYPDRLGYWPAAIGLLAFGALELVANSGDEPRTVALATVVYSILTLGAMSLYGTERWCDRGEAFSVYFGLLARIAPLRADGRRILVRRPLSGLPSWPALPGAVAVLAVMIGIVTFDGLTSGKLWLDLIDGPIDGLVDGGVPVPRAQELVHLIGLLTCVAVVGGFYLLGSRGARSVDRSNASTVDLARDFAHTLVPIAFAYAAAHYVSLLLFQGQAVAFLASDPLGQGSDLLGTATWTVDYAFIGAETFWYLQVGFVVAGHVAGLVLAHDRALLRFPDPHVAVRSQLWLLAVMVAFTCLALWLLSEGQKA